METKRSATSNGVVGAVAVLAVPVGALVFGYGLLRVPTSVAGGVWIAAIGLSMLLSGVFATEWAGDRFELPASSRRKLSLAFAVLAVILLVSFAVINGATFESAEFESSTGTIR